MQSLIIGISIFLSIAYYPIFGEHSTQIDYAFDSNGTTVSLIKNETKTPDFMVTTNDHELIDRLKQLSHSSRVRGPIIPILVIACNRISVHSCLIDLIRYRPNSHQFPIIVSQDCDHEPTKNVIKSFNEVTYMRQPDQSQIDLTQNEEQYKGYYKISRHYKWALNTTFAAGFEYLIIVEDDLNISPDFYEYFLGTYELLKNDSTLWCVSAYNDNGKLTNIDISSPQLLYRSDFFPGLGWMLQRELWNELSLKWPKGFWDDWMREPQQRKNRACIRPEIPRSRTFGRIGVSNGYFFDEYLQYIMLNNRSVEFTKMNLTYLLKHNYDREFLNFVYSRPVMTMNQLKRNQFKTHGPVRILYNHNQKRIRKIIKRLGLMDNFKAGVPRTSYLGIVSVFHNNRRIYLTPSYKWRAYEKTWT